MAIFVALGKTTDEGVRHMENLPGRHEQARKRVAEAGGKLIGSYAVMGRYDYVVILDFPDEKTAMRFMTREASRGHVRYETMSAIPMESFTRLIEE